MNPLSLFSLIPDKFQLLAKGIASVLLLIALWAAWHAFTGHYVDIGRKEVQKDWDKQKAIDAQLLIEAKEAVRAKESLNAVNQAAIDNKLMENHQSEQAAYEKTIADLKSGINRMRLITGKPETDHGMPETGTSISGNNETCSIRLPATIAEPIIGIGSEANAVADQLRACQALLTEDRKVCDGR